MKLIGAKKYLWLPAAAQAESQWITLSADGRVLAQLQVCIGGPPWQYFPFKIGGLLGQEIKLTGNLPQEWQDAVVQKNEPPKASAPFRPLFHYTPSRGWINDPNGLLFYDHIYHIYYQYNPYGVAWGNMHWGHAVSRDLFSWEEKDPVLAPDETGVMFSGSAVADAKNLAGYGQNSVLYYYTAAGGTSPASQGKPYVQMLAFSGDGGMTLQKTGRVMVGPAGEGARDPKVFYHADSGMYIMTLYLEGNDFGIYRSENLTVWEMTQRLTLDQSWECPDLFPLPVNDDAAQIKWVFWSADGYYFVGDFDGCAFIPRQERREAYRTALPYAAQTFSGLSGRVLSLSWLRTGNGGRPYTGMLSVPSALGLIETRNGYRLTLQPAAELQSFFKAEEKRFLQGEEVLLSAPCLIHFTLPPKGMFFLGGVLSVYGESGEINSRPFLMDPDLNRDFTILLDYGVIEIWGNGGLVYAALETPADFPKKGISLRGKEIVISVRRVLKSR